MTRFPCPRILPAPTTIWQTTYKEQDKLDDAVEAFRKALAAQPDLGPAYSNLLYLYASTRHISPEAERAVAEGWETSMLTGAERAAARERARGIFRPSLAIPEWADVCGWASSPLI